MTNFKIRLTAQYYRADSEEKAREYCIYLAGNATLPIVWPVRRK